MEVFLQEFTGWTPIIHPHQVKSEEAVFLTDASVNVNLGWGSFSSKTRQWSYGMWDRQFFSAFNPSINFLELFAVVVTIVSLGGSLVNKRVHVYSDNTPTGEAVTKGTSPSKQMMMLIRIITLFCMHNSITLVPLYVEGKLNCHTDLLSHLQMPRFLQLLKDQEDMPSESWTPDHQIWQLSKGKLSNFHCMLMPTAHTKLTTMYDGTYS